MKAKFLILAICVTFFASSAQADHDEMYRDKCVFIKADSSVLQVELENGLSLYFGCISLDAASSDVVLQVDHKLKKNPGGGIHVLLKGYVLKREEILGGWEQQSKVLFASGISGIQKQELALDALLNGSEKMLNALFGYRFTNHLDPPAKS